MGIIVMGVSHKTAPVEMRERLALPPEQLLSVLEKLKTGHGIQESVILSTCNRFEVYARPNGRPEDAVDALSRFFQGLYSHPKLSSSIYHLESLEAVKHLFRVASGLDSMVVGESEILGQVKAAYMQAHKSGATGKVTNVLFQRALYVGKQIRTKTGISEGASSVGSTAVQLAERIFGQLAGHRVLILGAGKMAEVTARHLLSQKAGHIMVLNRTLSRAQELAAQFKGEAGPMEKLDEELLKADIVVCSTAADKPVITKEKVREIMKERRERSLYFVDIAVPRNVDPRTHELDNVYVYNIDDLRTLVDENMARRKSHIEAIESSVGDLAKEFSEWLAASLEGKDRPLRHHANPSTEGLE